LIIGGDLTPSLEGDGKQFRRPKFFNTAYSYEIMMKIVPTEMADRRMKMTFA